MRIISDEELKFFERRKTNGYERHSNAGISDKERIEYLNECLDKVDPNGEQAFRIAREMLGR